MRRDHPIPWVSKYPTDPETGLPVTEPHEFWHVRRWSLLSCHYIEVRLMYRRYRLLPAGVLASKEARNTYVSGDWVDQKSMHNITADVIAETADMILGEREQKRKRAALETRGEDAAYKLLGKYPPKKLDRPDPNS